MTNQLMYKEADIRALSRHAIEYKPLKLKRGRRLNSTSLLLVVLGDDLLNLVVCTGAGTLLAVVVVEGHALCKAHTE